MLETLKHMRVTRRGVLPGGVALPAFGVPALGFALSRSALTNRELARSR